jgi:tetratricopeptide (TPR) repeat protein
MKLRILSALKMGKPFLNGHTAPRRTSGWVLLLLCLGLAAITFAVFGRTLGNGFINLDDGGDVYENRVVAQGLTLNGLAWAFSFHSSNWFPLTWLSHMLDCQLYGLHPGGHHFSNLLLHAATVVLLFLVLREMTGALWRSAFVAAVFAIHPLRVESVAWVAERKDVLSGLFFILTIGAYVRYARRPWSLARYGLVVLLFALGLMSKSMLVTLPFVLLLLDYWPLQRLESARQLVMEKLPLLALSAGVGMATLFAQREGIQSAGSFSLPYRLGNALAACMVYLGQMVWPAGLAVLYPFPRNGLPKMEVALAAILVAGLSVIAWVERRRRPWLLAGWGWYLVMLLPVLGIIQVGEQAHADRYTYLPQIGLYFAVTWLVAQLPLDRLVLGGLMTGVLAAFMVCAWQQTAYWHDSETLWTRALACTKRNDMAHRAMADALFKRGELDDAIAHYKAALEVNPLRAETQNNFGIALAQKGSVDDAIAHYQLALRINPNYAEAHNNLGVALRRKGNLDEATTQYRMALQINPNYAEAHYNFGIVLLQRSRTAEAINQYQEALRIDPANTKVQNNLAWLLATCADASLRNGKRAVELARRANEISGGADPSILDTLAAAFAEAGRFSDAKSAAQRAMELARAAGQQDLVAELKGELKLYEAGLPFH